jgi:hypothetical protein
MPFSTPFPYAPAVPVSQRDESLPLVYILPKSVKSTEKKTGPEKALPHKHPLKQKLLQANKKSEKKTSPHKHPLKQKLLNAKKKTPKKANKSPEKKTPKKANKTPRKATQKSPEKKTSPKKMLVYDLDDEEFE